ncbi:hypothetical protein EVG20_g706 [Dentipellis fragilis]|uniref:SET domain-containing protein n=1 Tax=Dentipellis fragilis TaxID=205917 RepID=A0A4Y9ZBW9_9AGAM|nr:hypothetical protein EVG20_g706 [Dentipellis fragilis]
MVHVAIYQAAVYTLLVLRAASGCSVDALRRGPLSSATRAPWQARIRHPLSLTYPASSATTTTHDFASGKMGFRQAAVISCVCFFLGVLCVCLNVDYRVLFVELTDETVEDGFKFYTMFFNAPPAIKALLHGLMGVTILGLVGKVHKWDESAMFFDGGSLAVFVFCIAMYLTVLIPSVRTAVAPVAGVDTREDQVEALRIASAANLIVIVLLGAILVMQGGQEYARRIEARELAKLEEEERAAKADNIRNNNGRGGGGAATVAAARFDALDVDSDMAPPESAKITALLAWCAENSVSIDSRIELVDDPDTGISVHSGCAPIPCPSSLVTIPKSAVLSAKSCFLSALINHVPYGIGAHLALAFAVHSELLRGRESRWFGYLQSLPREDDGVGIALFWGSDLVSGENDLASADGREARRWLVRTQASTHLRSETGASITDQVRDWYHDVVHPRLAALGLPTTLRGFCHAYALVLSRAFVVDSFHGLAMVPVADAFNHTQDHHVHLETEYDVCAACGSLSECPHDDDLTAGPPDLVPPGASQAGPDVDNSCEMVSNAPIQANEEVFNTYGEKLTNAELLVRYGFALDGNENDFISWTAEEVWDAGCSGGESAWGALNMFMEVVATWRSFQGWTDSALVSNADGANGEDSAGGIGTPRDAPPLWLMADGTISHSLWVICALGAMYKTGNNGSGRESAERTIGFLKRVAYAQVHMENTSASGDDEAGAGREEEKIYEKMVADVVRTVVSLCRGRLDRLVEGTELKSSVDVGEYADTLPDERRRTRLGVMAVLEEMSVLESCLMGRCPTIRLPPQSPLNNVSPRPLLLIRVPLPAMDTDWCLSCNCHLDGVAGVYCSPECYENDNPSSSAPSDIFEQSQYSHPPATSSSTNRWKGNDHAGILAWARDVSPGLPPDPSSSRDSSPKNPATQAARHAPPTAAPVAVCLVASPGATRALQTHPHSPIIRSRRLPSPFGRRPFHDHLFPHRVCCYPRLLALPVSRAPEAPLLQNAPPVTHPSKDWTHRSRYLPAPTAVLFPPLAVPDEDLLPASKSGWDGREEDMLAGWFASQVEKKGNKTVVLSSRPPLDIAEHPAFRSRGRRTARALFAPLLPYPVAPRWITPLSNAPKSPFPFLKASYACLVPPHSLHSMSTFLCLQLFLAITPSHHLNHSFLSRLFIHIPPPSSIRSRPDSGTCTRLGLRQPPVMIPPLHIFVCRSPSPIYVYFAPVCIDSHPFLLVEIRTPKGKLRRLGGGFSKAHRDGAIERDAIRRADHNKSPCPFHAPDHPFPRRPNGAAPPRFHRTLARESPAPVPAAPTPPQTPSTSPPRADSRRARPRRLDAPQYRPVNDGDHRSPAVERT